MTLNPFGWAVALRNAAYDRGWFAVNRFPVPVLSVGNITVGGTGKSPVVDALVGMLQARGLRVAVVSRGYRRRTTGFVIVSDGLGHVVSAADGGDEPVMLSRRHPGAVVVADERRSRGCREACDRFAPSVIVLDDAFQHRAVARDADIVCIDAGQDPFEDRLLPFGRLREPVNALRRATLIVLTRCGGGDACARLAERISARWRAPVVVTDFETATVRLRDGSTRAPSFLAGEPVLLFSGIARPDEFRKTIASHGADIRGHLVFRDHHAYTTADVSRVVAAARAAGARLVATTEKDAVRLDAVAAGFDAVDVCWPVLDLRIRSGHDALASMLRIAVSERDA